MNDINRNIGEVQMFNKTPLFSTFAQTAGQCLVAAGIFLTPQTFAQPSNKPLLSGQQGAKPNLMINMDNSGSMAFTYNETYGIVSNTTSANEMVNPPQLAQCPLPWANAALMVGGPTPVAGDACYNPTTLAFVGWISAFYPAGPAHAAPVGTWSAQRSANVNSVYYNPRTTYLPRVDSNGVPITPNDGIVFVSNQNSTTFTYTLWRNAADQTITTSSMNAANPNTTGYTAIVSYPYSLRIPQHITYTTATANAQTPAFTYATCTPITTPEGFQVGCSNITRVNVVYGSNATIALPTDHKRTDCSNGVCTTAQEITNILNWYRYYSTRSSAAATAIGQALANPDFDNQFRIGYFNINSRNQASMGTNTQEIETAPDDRFQRGVRMHSRGGTDTTNLYNWLYNHNVGAGTPLHNAVDRVASYYRRGNNPTRSPWATNPTANVSATNREMMCRRSFNLLFSDGSWTRTTSTNNGSNSDFTAATPRTRTLTQCTAESFAYNPNPLGTVAQRKTYTPYGSSATGGLADLTAQYFWHEDFRPGPSSSGGLDDGIQTRTGQPTFWQNMATYTVGYLVNPSGANNPTTGLRFADIDKYQADYVTLGASAVRPNWPSAVALPAQADPVRIDDFIQAGYTGGGRGFSAKNANDVRDIFNTILADILTSSGQDAGISPSGGAPGTDNSSFAGMLKYLVSYKTLDNSGDITAYPLDANGNVVTNTNSCGPVIQWSATEVGKNMLPADRLIYSMDGTASPVEFKGAFTSLPTSIRNALKQGPDQNRIANDASFVNYIRGLDPVQDPDGKLFRVRASYLGAIVNPPALYMGGSLDYAYDLSGNVQGASSYGDFISRKHGYPASLFVASNAGMMHALDAKTGVEQASILPRRILPQMLDYANEAYQFKYSLDGPISQNDVYDASVIKPSTPQAEAWKAWKHLGIGTGGRGSRLIYAVNSPIKPKVGITPPNRIPDVEDFRWEIGPDSLTASGNVDVTMGYITNYARSGQSTDPDLTDNVDSGKWIVAVNNGHYNGEANQTKNGLIVLNALNGDVIRTIPLPDPDIHQPGRGLSAVTMVRNSDKRVVAAYAGDAGGNLWRFDLRGAPSAWKVSYNKPLFTTPGKRPIYGHPAWQVHNKEGAIVVVATGISLEESDIADVSAQEAIYGIWDPTPVGENDVSPFTTVAENSLLNQSVLTASERPLNGRNYYRLSNNRINWNTHRGWRLPMGAVNSTAQFDRRGERSIADIQNINSKVIIASTVLRPPSAQDAEICTVSSLPENCIYILDSHEASSSKSRAFDVNGDQKADDFSVVCIPGGGFSRGVAVLRKPSSDSTTIPPGGTTPPPLSTSDPAYPLDSLSRTPDGGDESAGEAGKPGCRKQPIFLQSAAGDGINADPDCNVSGWSRSQYQLTSPPSK